MAAKVNTGIGRDLWRRILISRAVTTPTKNCMTGRLFKEQSKNANALSALAFHIDSR